MVHYDHRYNKIANDFPFILAILFNLSYLKTAATPVLKKLGQGHVQSTVCNHLRSEEISQICPGSAVDEAIVFKSL